MTGYASLRRPTSAGELQISLRSVNHRGLDLHFYLSGELAAYENSIRSLLKSRLGRGHVEVRLSLGAQPDAVRGGSYNRELLSRYIDAFRQASTDFNLQTEPDLTKLFSLPGVMESAREPRTIGQGFEAELTQALTACVEELNATREREGSGLVAAINAELDGLEQAASAVAAVRADLASVLARRLRDRIQVLLEGSTLSENRVVEEVAILADRSDIQEELTRLTVHTAELRRMLLAGGEVGKRLDFLLQEMNRETNTILSKSSAIADSGLSITNHGIGMKANIERMREQALNLE